MVPFAVFRALPGNESDIFTGFVQELRAFGRQRTLRVSDFILTDHVVQLSGPHFFDS